MTESLRAAESHRVPRTSHSDRTGLRRTVAALAFLSLALGVLAAGCKPSPEEKEANREEIAAFLKDYLPKMAEAYRTGDTEPLAGYAAQKEREAIKKRVRDLAKQGQILSPKLDSLQVENVTTWSRVNAYVTTVEVWDLRVLAAGSNTVLRQELNQSNRVKYQLKRDGGRWRIFWRQLEKAYDNN